MTGDVTTHELLAAIQRAGQREIDAIDTRIIELKRQIDKLTYQPKEEIRSLQTLRRVIKAKLLTTPNTQVKLRGKCQSEISEWTDLQKRVYDLIVQEGSLPVPVIAKRLNQQPAAIGQSVRSCDWFEASDGEVRIAMKKATA
ncbi:MAG: hypothetical protein ACYC4U_11175 [Pirellulaceae bacterium]